MLTPTLLKEEYLIFPNVKKLRDFLIPLRHVQVQLFHLLVRVAVLSHWLKWLKHGYSALELIIIWLTLWLMVNLDVTTKQKSIDLSKYASNEKKNSLWNKSVITASLGCFLDIASSREKYLLGLCQSSFTKRKFEKVKNCLRVYHDQNR